MTVSNIRTSSFGSKVTDIIVLTASFLLFAMIMEYENFSGLIIDLFLYVVVVFTCLQVSRRLILEYVHSSKNFVNILTGNITGLAVGGVVIFIINLMLPGIKESMVVVVFASVLAFFVLGTLSPMVKSTRRDIIHH